MASLKTLSALRGIAEGLQQASALWAQNRREESNRKVDDLIRAYQLSLTQRQEERTQRQEERAQQTFQMETEETKRRLQEVAEEKARLNLAKQTLLKTYPGLSEADADAWARNQPISPAGQSIIQKAELEGRLSQVRPVGPPSATAPVEGSPPTTQGANIGLDWDSFERFSRLTGKIDPEAFQRYQQNELASRLQQEQAEWARKEEARTAEEFEYRKSQRPLEERRQEIALETAQEGLNAAKETRGITAFNQMMALIEHLRDAALTADETTFRNRQEEVRQGLAAMKSSLTPEMRAYVEQAVSGARRGGFSYDGVRALADSSPALALQLIREELTKNPDSTDKTLLSALENDVQNKVVQSYGGEASKFYGLAMALNSPEIPENIRRQMRVWLDAEGMGGAARGRTEGESTAFDRKMAMWLDLYQQGELTPKEAKSGMVKLLTGQTLQELTGGGNMVLPTTLNSLADDIRRKDEAANQNGLLQFYRKASAGKIPRVSVTSDFMNQTITPADFQYAGSRGRQDVEKLSPEELESGIEAIVREAAVIAGGDITPVRWLPGVLMNVYHVQMDNPLVQELMARYKLTNAQITQMGVPESLAAAAELFRGMGYSTSSADLGGLPSAGGLPIEQGGGLNGAPVSKEAPPPSAQPGLRIPLPDLPIKQGGGLNGAPVSKEAPPPSAPRAPNSTKRPPAYRMEPLPLPVLRQREATVRKQMEQVLQLYWQKAVLKPEQFQVKLMYLWNRAFPEEMPLTEEGAHFLNRPEGAATWLEDTIKKYHQRYQTQAAARSPFMQEERRQAERETFRKKSYR